MRTTTNLMDMARALSAMSILLVSLTFVFTLTACSGDDDEGDDDIEQLADAISTNDSNSSDDGSTSVVVNTTYAITIERRDNLCVLY